MKPRLRVSRTAIDLIKRFEGYRRKAAQLPDGRWTIGYGHTLTARQGAEVDEQDAEALLVYDLIAVAHALNEHVFAPLTQNQFDALASFAFNIGLDNFRNSSVLKRLNEGALIQAGCAMELWRKADFAGQRIVIDALVRRRSVEKTLFLTPQDGAWVAAPSPILRPSLDLDALGVVPQQVPAEITASLVGDRAEASGHAPPSTAPSDAEEDEAIGPVTSAAEAVTNRLQTLFQDPGCEPDMVPPEAVYAPLPEPPREPEPNPPPEPEPAPPTALHFKPLPNAGAFSQATPLRADPEPLTLQITYPAPPPEPPSEPEPEPDPEVEAQAAAAAFTASPLAQLVEELRGPDLFAPPQVIVPAPRSRGSGQSVAEPPPPLPDGAMPETMFTRRPPPQDDFDFDETPRAKPRLSVVSLLALAAMGLAFFGGGVFWALSGRSGASIGPVTPLMVGWLAGLAGIACFVVAVFLLLERLGRSGPRD